MNGFSSTEYREFNFQIAPPILASTSNRDLRSSDEYGVAHQLKESTQSRNPLASAQDSVA